MNFLKKLKTERHERYQELVTAMANRIYAILPKNGYHCAYEVSDTHTLAEEIIKEHRDTFINNELTIAKSFGVRVKKSNILDLITESIQHLINDGKIIEKQVEEYDEEEEEQLRNILAGS